MIELLHQPEEIVGDRYRIVGILGQGGTGITYQAHDLQNDQPVALKVLSLRRMDDWKMLELFRREAQVLEHLEHPAIPRYLNYFETDTEGDRQFYLVQQLAPGKSLTAMVEQGWQPNEAEVRQIAIRVLNILIYLQTLLPPVIHRDIKPQNLIRQPDGQLFLVDFGAVQDAYHHTVTGGSTIIGTYGYMAPEQYRGQAVFSTDLYGLGTTLLFLLTQHPPADLPQHQLKLLFRPQVQISQRFADWLERILEPVADDRFATAQEALDVLQGRSALSALAVSAPKHTPIRLTKNDHSLVIEIPRVGLRTPQSRQLGLVALIWDGLLLLLIGAVLILSLFPRLSNLVWLGGFALIGLWILTTCSYAILSRVRLELDSRHFYLQKWLLGSRYCNVKGNLSQIQQVQCQTILKMSTKHQYFTACILRLKWQKWAIGACLTPAENAWLVQEIQAFLVKSKFDRDSRGLI
jgi:serine/threonine protein kinase